MNLIPPIERLGSVLLLCLVLGLAGNAVHHVARTLSHPYPVEYGEGVVLHWVGQSLLGQPLYPPLKAEPPYLHNPYTPLFYWVTAPLHLWTRNLHPFLAGRIVSLLGVGMAAIVIGILVRRRAGPLVGMAACALFCLSPLVLRYACMERVDGLALGGSFAALLLLDRFRSRGAIALAAALCAAAFLTKPTFVAVALAGACAAFQQSRLRGWLFVGSFAMVAMAMLTGILAHPGNDPALHLLNLNRLPLCLTHLLSVMTEAIGRHPFLFAGLAFALVRFHRTRDVIGWYGLAALGAIPLSAKVGAEENYYLELVALAALTSGRLAAEAGPRMRKGLAACFAAQLLLFIPVHPEPVFTRTYGQELTGAGSAITPTQADRDMGDWLTRELVAASGPVLCEDLGYLAVAGQAPIVEPYQFSHLARAGRWSDAVLIRMLNTHAFSRVVLRVDPKTRVSEYFTPAMLDAIDQNYRLKRTIGSFHVYEPGLDSDAGLTP